MPSPSLPSPIGIRILGLDNAPVENALVTVAIGSESMTKATNTKGEAIFHAANFTSSILGDAISISAVKEGIGSASGSLVVTQEPQQITLTLEQISTFTYAENPGNIYPLNLSMLTTFDGTLVTHDNPLPVETNPPPKDVRYDSSDDVPDYIGLHFESYNADTSENKWIVYKFTYSGINVTRIQKRTDVAWDDRSRLF